MTSTDEFLTRVIIYSRPFRITVWRYARITGMTRKERLPRLRVLWLQHQPEGQRTRNHVVAFYEWLEKEHHHLVPPKRGTKDPYQTLQLELSEAGVLE
jgi:hypothetical protein